MSGSHQGRRPRMCGNNDHTNTWIWLAKSTDLEVIYAMNETRKRILNHSHFNAWRWQQIRSLDDEITKRSCQAVGRNKRKKIRGTKTWMNIVNESKKTTRYLRVPARKSNRWTNVNRQTGLSWTNECCVQLQRITMLIAILIYLLFDWVKARLSKAKKVGLKSDPIILFLVKFSWGKFVMMNVVRDSELSFHHLTASYCE